MFRRKQVVDGRSQFGLSAELEGVLRVRVDVVPDSPTVRWEDVHGAARGVVYSLIEAQDAALARELHDKGWRGKSLKPVGVAGPLFVGAPLRRGVFTTSRDGSVWFGSPVPEIASVLVRSLASCSELDWGTTRLSVRGIALEDGFPGVAGEGLVELETLTPVVIKHESRNLLPGDEHFVERLAHNLAHKADLLGLPAPRGLRVLEAGPRRRFAVRGAPRIGAKVRVELDADARFVEALRSWGMGLDTIQGFGWIK
ncbi:CRISPR-associated endoribonuclease Cas6 [Kitasatospora phosalacinea]|uniref:CRISPR-associated endoribonuclease Cas6 n=1 Tax=Kitasatospora phosalacinea TaxID=2065 RepID=UPI0036470DA6